MRSEEDIYKRYSNIAVIFFIFPLVAFFIFKDFLRTTEEARISGEVWKNNFVKHGISSFTFVTDTIYYKTDYHGAAWTELKKLYINGHLANPDTLFEKKDLLIYHCGKYFFFGSPEEDSICYEFPPKDEYKTYGKGIFISSGFFLHADVMYQYLDDLPDCDKIKRQK